MKTVTEFSGTVLRQAAEIRRAHRPARAPAPETGTASANGQSHAPAEGVDETTEAAEEAVPAEAGAESAGEASSSDAAPAEAASGDEASAEAASAEAAPAEAGSETGESPSAEAASPGEESVATEEPSSEASASEADTTEASASGGDSADASAAAEPSPPVVDESAVRAAAEIEAKLDIKGDRLARLMDSLEVLRDRADNVRLIRVLSGEDPPQGAKKQGDFYFQVDLLPRPEPRRNNRGPGGPAAVGIVTVAAVRAAASAAAAVRVAVAARVVAGRVVLADLVAVLAVAAPAGRLVVRVREDLGALVVIAGRDRPGGGFGGRDRGGFGGGGGGPGGPSAGPGWMVTRAPGGPSEGRGDRRPGGGPGRGRPGWRPWRRWPRGRWSRRRWPRWTSAAGRWSRWVVVRVGRAAVAPVPARSSRCAALAVRVALVVVPAAVPADAAVVPAAEGEALVLAVADRMVQSATPRAGRSPSRWRRTKPVSSPHPRPRVPRRSRRPRAQTSRTRTRRLVAAAPSPKTSKPNRRICRARGLESPRHGPSAFGVRGCPRRFGDPGFLGGGRCRPGGPGSAEARP